MNVFIRVNGRTDATSAIEDSVRRIHSSVTRKQSTAERNPLDARSALTRPVKEVFRFKMFDLFRVFYFMTILSSTGNLRAHVRRLHLPTTAPTGSDQSGADLAYRCDDCSAIFRNVSSLTSHMSKFHVGRQQQIENGTLAPAATVESGDILLKALERRGLPLSASSGGRGEEKSNESTTLLVDRANPTTPM